MQVANKIKDIMQKGVLGIEKCTTKYNLTIGQPDFNAPESIKAAAQKAIENNMSGYIKTGGEDHIKSAILKNLSSKYKEVAKNQDSLGAVVTSGITGGLYCSLVACLNAGDEVIIPDPYFALYIDMIELAGGTPVTFSTYPDLEITAEKIQSVITKKTKILLLTSPNNPTGSIIKTQEYKKIYELCKKHNIIIISDEIYGSFAYIKDAPSFFDIATNAIVLHSFSKSHGIPGWRIGYAVAPKEIAQAIEVVQGNIFVNPPAIAHHIIPQALTYDNKEISQEYKRRRDLVINTLSDVCPHLSCDGGFFVFFNVSSSCGLSASQFVEVLKEKDVSVLSGGIFSSQDTHCRLSLTCNYNDLAQATKIIKETIIKHKKA